MSSKRGAGNQLIKDCEDEEESEVVGSFNKASSEEMAKRKILKISQSKPKIASSTIGAANPFGSISIANPGLTGGFSFGATSKPASTLQVPSKESIPSTGGFSFSSASTTTAPKEAVAPSGGFQFVNNTIPPLAKNIAPTNTTTVKDKVKGEESEYKKKMRKLNQSFLSWMDKQSLDHPLSFWKEGVKDYLKHSAENLKKYGNEDDLRSINNNNNNNDDSSMSIDDIKSKIDMKTKDIIKPIETSSIKIAPIPIKENEIIPNKIEPIVNTVAPPLAFSFGAAAPKLTTENNKKTEIAASTGFSFNKPITTTIEPPKTGSNPFSFSTNVTNFIASSKDKPNAPTAFGLTFTLPSKVDTFEGANKDFVPPISTVLSTSTITTAQNGDDDDEGEPILEPEKVLKNKDDSDIILHEVPCKLYRFDSKYQDCDKEGVPVGPIKPQWIDRGKGSFRVTKDSTTFKHRMIIRDAIGKITFNAAFYKNMKFDIQQNKSIKFLALIDSNKGMENFMIKLKEKDVDVTHKILLKSLSESQ